jgi:hypothetical protein
MMMKKVFNFCGIPAKHHTPHLIKRKTPDEPVEEDPTISAFLKTSQAVKNKKKCEKTSRPTVLQEA